MLIVSVAFIICWFPFNIYWMIVDNTTQTSNLFIGYFPTVFLAYLNICMNPFIYAMKHDGVRQKLASMMTRIKCKGPTVAGANSGSGSNNAGGTNKIHANVAPVSYTHLTLPTKRIV